MEAKDWEIEFSLFSDECDAISECSTVGGDNLPFLPHIGDILWVTNEIEDKLDERIKSCWRKNKCKDCPFMYGAKESETDVSMEEYVFVKNIIHNMFDKVVRIELSNEK